MTPEKRVQNKILCYLKTLKDSGYPVLYDRRQAGGFSYKAGQSDIWASIAGIHVEIECKREAGNCLSSMQEKWKQQCENAFVTFIEARSVDDVKIVVEKILSVITEKLI